MPKEQLGRTQQFLPIKEIKDGIVVLNTGALRKIILVDGINFDLKSEEEQDVITFAYQNFLNSLDFPIQINVHSRKMNIEDYLKGLAARLSEESNELLKIQLEEYFNFVKALVEKNAIMTKSFFVVVPFDPLGISLPTQGMPLLGRNKKPASTAKTDGGISPADFEQIQARSEQVILGLRQLGLRALVLEDPELLELYFNFYNPAAFEERSRDFGALLAKPLDATIVPQSIEVNSNFLKIGGKLAKTFFVLSYPRYLSSGWFSPVINLPELMDVSIVMQPVDTGIALKNLRKKAAQVESQIAEATEKGFVRDPVLETALVDIESLRDALQQAREKLFQVGIYITLYGDSLKEITNSENELRNILDSKLVDLRPAQFEQIKGFRSVLPLGQDALNIYSPLNSGPASSIFPFVSLELTSDNGVLYGVNRHNSSLIIFDRFSLENANMVIFAKAGSGKSYAAKLEILRSLMLGTEVLVVDPENEYRTLSEAVGGSVLKISLDSENHINPFDIPLVPEDEEPGEVLKSHIVNLTGLIKLMLGKITSAEEALLDRAITETYAAFDITPEKNFSGAKAPLLQDFESVLRGMEGGRSMAEKLYRFTKGSYAGFTNKPTNVNINNRLIVFSIRDLEDELRPIAMYIILNFIWNLIRAELKKRIMVIDEAWWMMKYPDSASFLFGLAKRARKYYLGISTITQDVEDFLGSEYGRPIITNSSLQLLLKQAPASVELTAKAFNLTEVEKNYLLEADIGQGLFVAGLKRAAIQIVPSVFENRLITTNPEEILKERI